MPGEKNTMTPKEFGAQIGRCREWVCERIAEGKIATLPPHRAPYLIPAAALVKFIAGAKLKRRRAAA